MKVKQKVMRDQYKNTNSNSGRTMNEKYKANNISKHTDSTPLLFRLRGEPSMMNKENNLQNINTNNGRTHKAIETKQMSKQLRIHSQISDDRKLMIKSTSAYEDQLNNNNNNQFINHNKFIASSFIVEPTTTQSIKENRNQSNRYQQNKKQHQGRIQLSQSHQYNNFQSKQNGNSRYGNNSNPMRAERPLTFGLVNQQNYLNKENQTLRSSKELVEEKHLKSHILDEIQEQQLMKKELIDSDEEQHQQRNYKEIACTNHTLKKAKYRLLVELGQGQDQMFYCSKCAINLLQQGFKIESITQQENNNTNININNIEIINYNNDRNNTLKLCCNKIFNLKQRIEMDKDLFNNHSQTKIYQQNMNDKKLIYNKLIQILNQMKTIDLKSLRNIYQQNSQILSHRQQTWISLEQQLQAMSQNLCNKQNELLQVSEQQFRTQIEMLMNNLSIYEQLCSDYNNKMHNYPIKHHNKIIQQLLNSYNNEKNNIKNNNGKQKIIKNGTNHHYEMFLCDQTQHPFRNLFPDEVKGYQNRQYPTFGIYNATTMQ